MSELTRTERAGLLKDALREVLDDPSRQAELKSIFQEALTEWLEAKWAELGKWSFRGIVAMGFTVLLYFFAKAKGLL